MTGMRSPAGSRTRTAPTCGRDAEDRDQVDAPFGGSRARALRTAARFAQHWNFVGGTTKDFARKRDVLHQHCADIGRDPEEITLSSHIMLGPNGDLAPAVERIAELGEQGLDLAIVYLPPPHDPRVLAPLAEALGRLG
jgi:alkanesulfonate monooxygenase SsuD/methylene tetrahydromethanopterin reductase-like flavin-dependent oxidoreductase (luciferase family)